VRLRVRRVARFFLSEAFFFRAVCASSFFTAAGVPHKFHAQTHLLIDRIDRYR
jgi:hypothetical protein